MSTYFTLLPKELSLDLSLYFNYRDTILVCKILKCDDIRLWINKIEKELGFSRSFVTQYVYDTTSKIKKTRLTLNEKYLELKSRKSVDFGSEQYAFMNVLINRASRLKDFTLASQLINYFFNIVKIVRGSNEAYDELNYYNYVVQGASSVGNFDLVDEMIIMSDRYSELPEEDVNRQIKVAIVKGLYEGSPTGEPDEDFKEYIFDRYDVKTYDYNMENVISGLARGGHLEVLIKLGIDIATNYDQLKEALKGGHKNVVDHYGLAKFTNEYPEITDYGQLHLLPSIDSITSFEGKQNLLLAYIRGGYLEYIDQYDGPITNITLYTSLISSIALNHLDLLAYIYSVIKDFVKKLIDSVYTITKTMDIYYNCVVEMIQFLYQNELLDKKQLQQLIIEQSEVMKQVNPDTLDYIHSLLS